MANSELNGTWKFKNHFCKSKDLSSEIAFLPTHGQMAVEYTLEIRDKDWLQNISYFLDEKKNCVIHQDRVLDSVVSLHDGEVMLEMDPSHGIFPLQSAHAHFKHLEKVQKQVYQYTVKGNVLALHQTDQSHCDFVFEKVIGNWVPAETCARKYFEF